MDKWKGGPQGSPFYYSTHRIPTTQFASEVYCLLMVRINIDSDEIAVEPMTLKEALAMCGTGWDGDIPESQKSNSPEE